VTFFPLSYAGQFDSGNKLSERQEFTVNGTL